MKKTLHTLIASILFFAYLLPVSAEPINILLEPDHIEVQKECCCGNEVETCCPSSCSIEESHNHQAQYLIGFSTLAKYRLGPLYFKTIKQLEKDEIINLEKKEKKFHFELINYNPIEKSLSGFIIPKHTSSSLMKLTK